MQCIDRAPLATCEPSPATCTLRGSILDALLARVDEGRLGRSLHREPMNISQDQGVLRAEVPGSEGAIWHPRVNLSSRSFGCDCPDHQKRKIFRSGAWTFKGGPCKHVTSLALTVAVSINGTSRCREGLL